MEIPEVDNGRNYWFIGTNGGEHYDDFIAEGVIAVGWNAIDDVELIQKAADGSGSKSAKEEANKRLEELVRGAYPDDARPELICRQLKLFVNDIKRGDVVLIGSENSFRVAMGEICSGRIVPPSGDYEGGCDWEKRKQVNWTKTVERDRVDPNLFPLFYTTDAVTCADDYASFIDRSLNSFFVKGDVAHFIIAVEQEDKVRATDLIALINGSLRLMNGFANDSSINLDWDSVGIRMNVQSSGTIEFFGDINVIWLLAAILGLIVGIDFEFTWPKMHLKTEGLLGKLSDFIEQRNKHKEEMKRIELAMRRLEVKLPEQAKPVEEEVAAEKEEEKD